MESKSRVFLLLFFTFCTSFALLVGASLASAWESAECQGCHGEAAMVGNDLVVNAEVFATTPHAEMGCPSCHMVSNSHPDGEPVKKLGCPMCHSKAAEEYSGGIHAEIAACIDCHDPHSALGAASVSGYAMNQMCTNCHAPDTTAKSHAEWLPWLPQTEVHLGTVPCVTCHTNSKEMAITWYISNYKVPDGEFTPVSYEELAERANNGEVPQIIDTNNNGRISINELSTFNTADEYRKLHLAGMMIPEEFSHDFAMPENRWDCTFCHASGPDALQTSFVAFPEADGTLQRLPVEEGAVLDALYATPNFYVIGATRNPILNWIGGIILVGGLLMPLGHGTLRLLTMKNRRH